MFMIMHFLYYVMIVFEILCVCSGVGAIIFPNPCLSALYLVLLSKGIKKKLASRFLFGRCFWVGLGNGFLLLWGIPAKEVAPYSFCNRWGGGSPQKIELGRVLSALEDAFLDLFFLYF